MADQMDFRASDLAATFPQCFCSSQLIGESFPEQLVAYAATCLTAANDRCLQELTLLFRLGLCSTEAFEQQSHSTLHRRSIVNLRRLHDSGLLSLRDRM